MLAEQGLARSRWAGYSALMTYAIRYLLPGLLVLLSLAGCQSLTERSDAEELTHTLDSYGATARWQSLAGLYAFLQPALQPEVLPEGLDKLRITGYEVMVRPRKLAEDRVV